MRSKENVFTTLDLYLSSYLSLKNLKPTLEINHGKVIFAFSATDTLYKLIAEYNSNQNVPIADFVTELKILRGRMLSLRDSTV